MCRSFLSRGVATSGFVFVALSSPAFADNAPAPTINDTVFGYVMVGLVAFALLLAFVATAKTLNGRWPLSEALSEEANITKFADGQPIVDATNKPMMFSELRPSTSRLIALLGSFGILALFLGFGLALLKDFAQTGQLRMDGFPDLIKYLVAGTTLFAPYVANKAASLFDITPQKN